MPDEAPPGAPAPLQFETAELPQQGALACAACQSPISDVYFDVNGNTACGRCKELLAGRRQEDPLALAKATGLGLGAAAVGATGWWLVRYASDGSSWGIVAIAVGWLVGRAVRKGSGGFGGPVYQALAVGLTYLAVAGTYVPDVYAAVTGPEAGDVSLLAALPDILIFLLSAPFRFSGVIGYLIIGFGLWEAFRVNSRAGLKITGPYQLGAGPRAAGG